MASLTCAFRYGREDLDVLGLTFRKELHSGTYDSYSLTHTRLDRFVNISKRKTTSISSVGCK